MDKKYSELNYIELVKEYKLVVDNTDILKKDIILEMAKKKEIEGVPKHKISKIIIDDLVGYANDDYIRKVLGSEYTDQRFNPNRNKESKKVLITTNGEQIPEIPKEIIDLTVTPPKSFEEFKKENPLLVNSIYPEDKNPANDPITQEDKETFEKLTSMEELEQENKKLKQEIQDLKSENEKLKAEIRQLKEKTIIAPINQNLNPIDKMNQFSNNRINRLMKGKRL